MHTWKGRDDSLCPGKRSLWSWYEKLLHFGVLSVHQSKDGALSSSTVYMAVKSAKQSGAGRQGFLLFARAGKTQATYCPLKWDMQRDTLSIAKPPRMSYVFLREKRQRKTQKQGTVTVETERGLSTVAWGVASRPWYPGVASVYGKQRGVDQNYGGRLMAERNLAYTDLVVSASISTSDPAVVICGKHSAPIYAWKDAVDTTLLHISSHLVF